MGLASRQTLHFLHNSVGCTQNQLGHHEEAETLCRRAIALFPERHNAHKSLGLAYHGQGRWLDAVAELLEAAELCPRDGRALAHAEEVVERVSNLCQETEFMERLQHCRELSASDPDPED